MHCHAQLSAQRRHAAALARAADPLLPPPPVAPVLGQEGLGPCNLKAGWKRFLLLPGSWATTIRPTEMIWHLHYFANRDPPEKVASMIGKIKDGVKYTRDRHVVGTVQTNFRRGILDFLKFQKPGQMGGGKRFVPVGDQGHVTLQPRIQGQPVGRVTLGHQTHIFGLTELDLTTRTVTGKVFLRTFTRHDGPTFVKIFTTLVRPGTPDEKVLIFTDEHQSYNPMKQPPHSDHYTLLQVKHKDKQFVNRDAERSSSNAAEGKLLPTKGCSVRITCGRPRIATIHCSSGS